MVWMCWVGGVMLQGMLQVGIVGEVSILKYVLLCMCVNNAFE